MFGIDLLVVYWCVVVVGYVIGCVLFGELVVCECVEYVVVWDGCYVVGCV